MTEAATGDSVPIRLEFRVPSGLTGQYATNIVVQHTEHEFIVSFFQVENPFLLGTPEENRALLEQLGKVPAYCVGRVIVAAERMPAFVRVMKQNLDKYRRKKEEANEQP